MTDAIRYETGADQIVTLTLDMPGQQANTMNATYRQAMADVLERLQADKASIAGVIIRSAKKTFFAGGDLNELSQVDASRAAGFYQMTMDIKAQLRQSLPLKARRWAAGWSCVWPATIALP
jgi:3-hydroxyacyl-CoA dehydrogenase/enoyl-CoA hydratase/3-hydroxybutyryl-CoA epimerase